MPYAFIPPGYKAVLLGQAQDVEDLGTFVPLEENSAEGALFLMRLDFTEQPSEETLTELEQAFLEAGVEPWPGYGYFVYTDLDSPTVYLTWQKGLAWLPVIIGILVFTVLPPLLTTVVWWILPEEIKSLISGLINLGMLMLVMWLVFSLQRLAVAEGPRAAVAAGLLAGSLWLFDVPVGGVLLILTLVHLAVHHRRTLPRMTAHLDISNTVDFL